MTKGQIFFAELDDDYQDLLRIDLEGLIRRAYCYVLLADGIIIHPAYIWQSAASHTLILDKLAEVFQPPLAKIALGDSDSITDYMAERMEKLKGYRVRETTKELRQYARWESDLLRLAKALDTKYRENGTVSRLPASRDTKFRQLLEHDLAAGPDAPTIRNILQDGAERAGLQVDIEDICGKLITFVQASPLVSVETFATYVRSHGLPDVVESRVFKDRMLAIYYEANLGAGMTAPASAALYRERIVNFYDSEVFWAAFEYVFGKRAVKVLSQHTDPQVVRALRELRETEVWQNYRAVYFQVLEQLDVALWENAKLLGEKIKEVSGQGGVQVVRRLWRHEKKAIVAAVFGVMGLSTGSLVAMIPGILSMFFGSRRLVQAIDRFVHDYHTHDLTRLQYRITQEVEKIVGAAGGIALK